MPYICLFHLVLGKSVQVAFRAYVRWFFACKEYGAHMCMRLHASLPGGWWRPSTEVPWMPEDLLSSLLGSLAIEPELGLDCWALCQNTTDANGGRKRSKEGAWCGWNVYFPAKSYQFIVKWRSYTIYIYILISRFGRWTKVKIALWKWNICDDGNQQGQRGGLEVENLEFLVIWNHWNTCFPRDQQKGILFHGSMG